MEGFFNQIETNKDYPILNKDIEVRGKYFDIVPDGNLYTLDDYPIFAIRMRPAGINHIISFYKKKYQIECLVLTYKIQSNQYTLYTSDTKRMYEEQGGEMLKFFNFSMCKEGEFKGAVVVITNQDDRMIHAIPFLYGIVNNRRKLIFLDAFFSPDLGSGCIVGADFFYNAYSGEIDCYCHGNNIQADHHSCGIIACDFVKNCLKNKAQLAKKIIHSQFVKTQIDNYENQTQSSVFIYELPAELKKFSQLSRESVRNQVMCECKSEDEKKNRGLWFLNHLHTLLYRRDLEPYNPENPVVPKKPGQEKSINTSLLEKGHKYAGMIIKDLGQQTDYNYKYWLSLIRGQNTRGNIFRRLMKFTKNFLKKNT